MIEQIEIVRKHACSGGIVGSVDFKCEGPVRQEQFVIGSTIIIQLKSLVKSVYIHKDIVSLGIEVDSSILSAHIE